MVRGAEEGPQQEVSAGKAAVPDKVATRSAGRRVAVVWPAAQQDENARVAGAQFRGRWWGLWVLTGRDGRSQYLSGKALQTSLGQICGAVLNRRERTTRCLFLVFCLISNGTHVGGNR